jgi:hypothetical protein
MVLLNSIHGDVFKILRRVYVNREQFEARVEESAAPELRGSDALKAAMLDAGRRPGHFYDQDVRETLLEAGKRAEQELACKEEGAGPTRRPEPGAEAHFISHMLIKILAPWAEGLREEGFGHREPPFEDEQAAAGWIERTYREDLARWKENSEASDEDYEEVYRLAHRLGLDVTTSVRHLRYGRPGDDHVKNAVVSPGTFLAKLASEVQGVARRTGLPPDALTAHVLTDAVPILPRVRSTRHNSYFTLPSGQQIHLRSVTLTFRTADLTFEELRNLYSKVRSYMGGKGVRSTNLDDLEFWSLVEELGGPPEPYKGVRRFWQQVLHRWNADHPEREPLKSWEGLQDKYERLCKRLGASPTPFEIAPNSRD